MSDVLTEERNRTIIMCFLAAVAVILISVGILIPHDTDTSNDIKNWAAIFIEAGIAVFITGVVYYVSNKQQGKINDLTKQIKIVMDKQEELRIKRTITGLSNIVAYLNLLINSLDSINDILNASTQENKFRERLHDYLEKNTVSFNKMLSVNSIGPPGFVDEVHQLFVLTKGWVQGLESVLDYIKGDVESDLYARLSNLKSKTAFCYNFEFGMAYIITIEYPERAFLRANAIELLKLIQKELELLKKPDSR